ncbi:hypothetical protein OLK001_17510 [Synechocystis sp. LKSZ1]
MFINHGKGHHKKYEKIKNEDVMKPAIGKRLKTEGLQQTTNQKDLNLTEKA